MLGLLRCLLLALTLARCGAYWSFQARLTIKDSNDGATSTSNFMKFGAEAMKAGRGFETIISGYDKSDMG